jgi:hypothetical protein
LGDYFLHIWAIIFQAHLVTLLAALIRFFLGNGTPSQALLRRDAGA